MDVIVLCCGSRFWNDKHKIEKEFDKLEKKYNRIALVVQGGAAGADTLCKVEAERRGIPACTFHANWFYYKKAAGPIRNATQLKFTRRMTWSVQSIHGGDLDPGYRLIVLAFHPNIVKSRGTRDMVEKARKAGTEVKIIA